MNKNNLLKNVSNVNDSSSQVISARAGLEGEVKDISLKNVLSTSPYGNENGSRYDFNAYVKEVWCPDFDFSYDYDQTYGIFDEDLEDLKDDEDDE